MYLLNSMDRNETWFNFLEELRSRCDLASIAGSYTNLNRRGTRYWGCCPLHHEKTPSFCITPELQRYKCFGCGESGDVIKFVQKAENLDFMGAVEFLAKRAGLTVPRTVGDKGVQDKRKRKQAMAEICLETAKFYRSHLMSPHGQFALEYLAGRGLSKSTIAKFGLGLSPDWDSLSAHLKSKDFDMEVAFDCGVVDHDKRGGYFDTMGQRLIVPIINSFGEVIAFGGRSMKQQINFAKYKNTKQTDLFDKSKNLFGINLVSKKKKQGALQYIIVVEGYMDAIALHQAGFDSAVASMGTSLTKEQARLMKRYVDKVYICYDGDAAGTKGTLRGLEILKEEGLDVRVMSMPDGIDPDELILHYGVEAYQKAIDDALPLTDYKLSIEKSKFDFNSKNDAEVQDAKRKYTVNALKIISKLDSLVEAESYLKKLSKEVGFSLDWLKREMSNVNTQEAVLKETKQEEKEQTLNLDKYGKALYFILACMIANEEYAVLDFEPDVEDDEFLKKSFEYVNDCKAQNKAPVAGVLTDIFEGGYSQNIDYLAETAFATTLENKRYFQDCVKLVRRKQIDDEIQRLNALYETEADNEKRSVITKELVNLMKQKNDMK